MWETIRYYKLELLLKWLRRSGSNKIGRCSRCSEIDPPYTVVILLRYLFNKILHYNFTGAVFRYKLFRYFNMYNEILK